MCNCMYACVFTWDRYMCIQVSAEAKGSDPLGPRETGACELPNMDAGNQPGSSVRAVYLPRPPNLFSSSSALPNMILRHLFLSLDCTVEESPA